MLDSASLSLRPLVQARRKKGRVAARAARGGKTSEFIGDGLLAGGWQPTFQTPCHPVRNWWSCSPGGAPATNTAPWGRVAQGVNTARWPQRVAHPRARGARSESARAPLGAEPHRESLFAESLVVADPEQEPTPPCRRDSQSAAQLKLGCFECRVLGALRSLFGRREGVARPED